MAKVNVWFIVKTQEQLYQKKMHCGDCFFKEVFDENKGNKIIKLSTTM